MDLFAPCFSLHALPTLLLVFSLPIGRGCSDIVLAPQSGIPFSQDHAPGVKQNQGGESICDSDRPKLAESAMGLRSDGAAVSPSLSNPNQ